MKPLTSFLAPQIESFIKFRKISENWNDSYEYFIHRFDKYCTASFPNAEILSQEMVDKWCEQHDTESNNACRTRIFALINLIRYLRARGKTDVNLPDLPQKERRKYIPHAFTEAELKNFFYACDNLPNTNLLRGKSLKITIPVFFRLLYSSGIRTTEARLLRTENVDLQQGILDVQYSKGNDQHYVALHDSMTVVLQQYDTAIGKLYPKRDYFFPALNGGNNPKRWVTANFRKLWDKSNSTHAIPYDLRHHYAIININKWIGMGFEFHDKLLYLSKSMGHRDIESTKYYYSLVPSLADILEDKTNFDFEDIVPEVDYEEV